MTYFLILILFMYMTSWFIVSIIKRRNDVADIAWGLGFVVLAWVVYFCFRHFFPQALLVNILVTIWGLRLSYHIFMRHLNHPEDYRYQRWRKEWGHGFYFFLRSYAQIFLLQGFLLWVTFLPVLNINQNPKAHTFTFFEILGVVIWWTGFLFEAIADWQLARFIKNHLNQGKLIENGLWSYSRHPNYFGEVVMWWGFFIISLSSPLWYLSIFGPITITILILFVSGIPLLEKKYAGRPDFESYKKRTSIFFPMKTKK
jgi:steroid 5-alpha reductase family enzyme